MQAIELTKDNFDEIVTGNDIVLVDFWAEWCGPCRTFKPIFEEAAERHPEIVFAKVDTEEERELASAFGIQSIPTLMAFREQVILYAQPGALPANVLDDLIGKVQEVDMEEVHKELAQHAAEGHGEHADA